LKKRLVRRIAASVAVLGAAVAASLNAAPPAQAWCAQTGWWPTNYIYAGIGNQIPAGWDPAIKAGMNQWSNVPNANWTIYYTASTNVHITVSYRTPDIGFPGGAPGATKIVRSGPQTLSAANVFLNPTWSWNLNGNFNEANKVADVRTVATHELGHQLLDHPWLCGLPMNGPETASVMNANYTKKWTINADDEHAVAYLK
jgi:hypothetical protein